MAGVVREAVGADRDTPATKADIAVIEARLKAETDTGLADLRADIADLRAYIDKLVSRN